MSHSQDFKDIFNDFCNLFWSMTYYSMHVDIKTIHYTEIMNNIIEGFNKFILRINNVKEKISIDQTNLNKICQFCIYLELNGKKYNISQKINLDFMAKIKFFL